MKKVNILSIIAILLSIILLASCSNNDADPQGSIDGAGRVSDATVTYTYNIPADLLDYVTIDASYNNNSNTDVIIEPVLDTTYKVTYRVSKFPTTLPIVFNMNRTNRPTASLSASSVITMNTTVRLTVGDREIEVDNVSTISASDINDLIKDVHKRTYAVKISKTGEVQFITPNNY